MGYTLTGAKNSWVFPRRVITFPKVVAIVIGWVSQLTVESIMARSIRLPSPVRARRYRAFMTWP